MLAAEALQGLLSRHSQAGLQSQKNPMGNIIMLIWSTAENSPKVWAVLFPKQTIYGHRNLLVTIWELYATIFQKKLILESLLLDHSRALTFSTFSYNYFFFFACWRFKTKANVNPEHDCFRTKGNTFFKEYVTEFSIKEISPKIQTDIDICGTGILQNIYTGIYSDFFVKINTNIS